MSMAHLGFSIDSSQAVSAGANLKKMADVAGQAEAAAKKLAAGSSSLVGAQRQVTGAAEAEARAMSLATAAANTHAFALQKTGAAATMAALHQRNLIFQLNDVAVSAFSGMSAQMILLQQGSQIFQNGIGNAFKSVSGLATNLLTKFWPIGLAVGAVTAAIGGMTAEINKSSKTTVSFGDTALATWQVISEGVYTFISPALDWLSGQLSKLWEWAKPGVIALGNGMASGVLGAVEIIKTAVGSIPDALTVAGESAANGFIGGIEWMVQKAMEGFNNILKYANDMLKFFGADYMAQQFGWGSGQFEIKDPASFKLQRADIGGAAAAARLQSGFGGLGERLETIGSSNPLGGLFDAIDGRSEQNALARLAADADGAEKATRSLADNGFGALSRRVNAFAEATQGAFNNMGSGLIQAFQKGGDVAGSVLDMILDRVGRVSESLLNSGLNGLLNMGISAIFGGPAASMAGGLIPGIGGFLRKASGGHVSGPGTGTSDSIPAMLSNGEFVINAAATAAFRPLLEAINGGGGIARFATGGFVRPADDGVEFNGKAPILA